MAHNTSEHAGYIRGGAARLIAESPVDTGDVRDSVINNLNHLQDSSCQRLVNVNGRTAGKATWDGAISSAAFERVALLPPLPICIRVLGDGSSSRVVVRLAAQITSAGTATWRFFLSPYARYAAGPPAPPADDARCGELSTTSTSVVELGPVSMQVSARPGTSSWQRQPSRDGNGDATSVEQMLVQLEVWSFSSSTGVPRIHALSAHEWIA